MKRAIPVAFAMLVGLIGSAQARDKATAPFREGTPVVIVG